MHMRVMALEDVMVTKLMAISEHHLRYESLLAMSRALRERIDWADVRRRTEDSPFARAFFVLLDGLGIVSSEETPSVPAATTPSAGPVPAVPKAAESGPGSMATIGG